MVCAPNAFKGSLTARRAAAAIAAGVRDAGFEAVELPVADGGDGTLDVLLAASGSGARLSSHEVTGPLGAQVLARLGWLTPELGVVEMAEAAGLRLLPAGRLDPMHATSRGAGELIAAALDAGAEQVIVGVGGSASSDGGAGLLVALGARLSGAGGRDIPPGGAGLLELEHIDLRGLRPDLRGHVRVACDVTNPLCGPDGAAAVFGPQKGASPAKVEALDSALRRFAAIAERDCFAAGLADQPGAGAAGGAGFGLLLAGASLLPGAQLVCTLAGLDQALLGAQLVITGEGRLDSQTPFGKAPSEVAVRARAAGVTAVAVAGLVSDPLAGLFARTFDLTERAMATGRDSFTDVEALLREAAADLARWSGAGSDPAQ